VGGRIEARTCTDWGSPALDCEIDGYMTMWGYTIDSVPFFARFPETGIYSPSACDSVPRWLWQRLYCHSDAIHGRDTRYGRPLSKLFAQSYVVTERPTHALQETRRSCILFVTLLPLTGDTRESESCAFDWIYTKLIPTISAMMLKNEVNVGMELRR
jgi:hypothetical protein